MVKILDGKKLSQEIADELRQKIKKMKVPPTLVIVQIGNRPESNSYIARKKGYGESIGVNVLHIKLSEKITTNKLLHEIKKLNDDTSVNGIIVQLPIPSTLDKEKIIESVAPQKDVDGLHSSNAGALYESASGSSNSKKHNGFIPATARGVITMLKRYNISIEGKRALVIGRSMLVGRPVALLLLKENATVTIAHSKSKDLKKICLEADIIIAAAGSPKMVKKGCFKKGQVIVDVGTNAVTGPKELEEGATRKLVGDVDFDEAKKIVAFISPVPGGVGPMTVASLFQNLLEYKK